jgi:hypothetical protein
VRAITLRETSSLIIHPKKKIGINTACELSVSISMGLELLCTRTDGSWAVSIGIKIIGKNHPPKKGKKNER